MRETLGMDLDDFMVETDIISWNSHKPVYFISTPNDPSVGIYGVAVSPYFRKVSRMKEFWKRYGVKILEAYYDDKIKSTEQFKARVKKITKGWS